MVVPELWWTRPDQLTDSHVLSRSLHQMRGSNLWPGNRGTTMGKLCAGKVESMFLEHKCHLCALVSLFVILHSIPFMWKNLELSAEKMRIPYTKPLFFLFSPPSFRSQLCSQYSNSLPPAFCLSKMVVPCDVPVGVITGDDVMTLFKHARDNGYAIPAFNCTRCVSSSSSGMIDFSCSLTDERITLKPFV